MAIVAASSWKSGNRNDEVVGDSVRSCRLAWNAAQDMTFQSILTLHFGIITLIIDILTVWPWQLRYMLDAVIYLNYILTVNTYRQASTVYI